MAKQSEACCPQLTGKIVSTIENAKCSYQTIIYHDVHLTTRAAESLLPGVQVSEVARKHGVTRWQVYDWRRRLDSEVLRVACVLPGSAPHG
nr:transposase [Bradyrhizobium elkanii]